MIVLTKSDTIDFKIFITSSVFAKTETIFRAADLKKKQICFDSNWKLRRSSRGPPRLGEPSREIGG